MHTTKGVSHGCSVIHMAETLYSSDAVCAMVDVSYRQLDYWTRSGTVQPSVESKGSGRPRRWTAHEVCAVRVVSDLRSMGATTVQMSEAWAYLMDLPLSEWNGLACVDRLGRLHRDRTAAGWMIDLRDARRCVPDLVDA